MAAALCGACGSGAIEGRSGADAAPPSGAADDPDESGTDGVGQGAIEMELPVAGNAPWTETGIEVARGDLVWLEATGTIFLNDTVEVGPAGRSALLRGHGASPPGTVFERPAAASQPALPEPHVCAVLRERSSPAALE